MAHCTMTQGKMLATNFLYHAPKDDQPARYELIRGRCKFLAEALIGFVPPSRELSLALTKLEEVCFWANAGIARNE